MKRTLWVLVAALVSVCAIGVWTVALSLVLILVGFHGNATLPADCGLVFGAAITRDGEAGPAILRRVHTAADLWKHGSITQVILTGGKGDAWRMSEAAIMRQEAIRAGIDGRTILVEDNSRSTKENLANTKVIVDEHCTSVVAISDQYHLGRIRLLAKRMGWNDLGLYGVPERPPLRGESWSVLRELGAYVYYAVGADAVLDLDAYDDDWFSFVNARKP